MKPTHISVSIWSVPGVCGAKARPFYSGGAAPRRCPAAAPRAYLYSPPHEEALPAITRRCDARVGPCGRGVGAAFAVPLLAQAPADPGAGHGRRLRRRARWRRRAAAADQRPRRRPLRPADVGLRHGPRAPLRQPGDACGAGSAPATRSRRPHDRRRRACPTPACSGRSPGCRGVGVARPPAHLGPLALVLRALPGADSGSWSATPSASRARRGRWPPSSTSAAPSTSRCRPRRRGGPRRTG